jgi:hypothetical protein
MNELKEIDLEGLDNTKKDEGRRMLSQSIDDFEPIQKNSRLFKFILYTSKVEIKSNSLIKLVYNTSLLEIFLWIVGFLMFMVIPSKLYLIWVLISHMFKGILGLILLSQIPKTYEILENIAKNPTFEEDKIMDIIQTQIKETFLERWTINRRKLLLYLITTIFSLIVDLVIFIVQICLFGNPEYFLMEASFLTIVFIFISKSLLIYSI